MSQQYPYTNTGDDASTHQDMYPDSYQRHSHTYQPSTRSTAHEQQCSTASSSRTVDTPVQLSGMALSFLHSCGLEPNDLAHLAELPGHLITVETLPKLLLQVKERKLSSTSSSRPSTSQPLDDPSSYAWEGSSHSKPIEYPLESPAQPLYPLPPEQVQSWQDRWGNPRLLTSVAPCTRSSRSKSFSDPDYSIPHDSDQYSNTTESTMSSSYTSFDSKPRPLLSLKLEPPVTIPRRKEAFDYNCKIPPLFPYMCSLCDVPITSRKDWISHVRGSKHAKGQLNLVKKFPRWDQTTESSKRIKSAEVYKVPTRKEASDFNGTSPPIFPYLCVLCNVTVFSEKGWSGHFISGQHAKSQLDLMEKYPEWDGTVQSARRSGHTSADTRDGASKESTSDTKKSQGKERSSRVVSLTPLPVGDGITSELTAIAKRFGSIRKSLFLPNQGYVEMACLADAKKLVEHYSAKQLKLKGKLIKVTFSSEYNSLRDAECNDKAKSCSSHTHKRSSPGKHSYQRDSTSPGRKHSSPNRRRSSEKTHSSPNRKCSSERTHSSPNRKRSPEKTHSSPSRKCSSERTHSSPSRKHSSERTQSGLKRKRSSPGKHSYQRDSTSPGRKHSSPNRRRSSERTHSSPKRKRSSERTHSSPKTNHSSERSSSSPSCHDKKQKDSQKSKEDSISTHTCHSPSSALIDVKTASIDAEELRSLSNSCDESMDSDSDLEGVEVIADDGEELAHDIDDHENTSDQESIPSEQMDTTDVCMEEQEKTEGDSPNVDTSNSLLKGQDSEEQADQEDDNDLPTILKHCVTLDEFTEENFSDCQESDEPKVSSPKTEETSDKIALSTNTVCDMKEIDNKSESPEEETEEIICTAICNTMQNEEECESAKEESRRKTTEELGASVNLDDAIDQPKEEQDTETENFGKVLEIRNLPSTEYYTDSDFMNIIKRYGDVTHYVLFRSCKMGFVEMTLATDADRVAADSKNRDIVLRGNILKITVTEKYCHLPEGLTFESGDDGDNDDDDEEIRKDEISRESTDKQQSNALNGNTLSSNESIDIDRPIGTEFVRPVVGYFCSLCNVIYASEEEAKDEHCRSPSHHQKVKEHKEKSVTLENKK